MLLEIRTEHGQRPLEAHLRRRFAHLDRVRDLEEERATEELTAAVDELGALRSGREIDPLARLAELRRRQGRTSEADVIPARVESHRFHALLTGLLALDRGDALAGRDNPAEKAEARARKAPEELGARTPEARVGGLSAREAEVLRLVARGLSNGLRRGRERARGQAEGRLRVGAHAGAGGPCDCRL